MITPNRVSTCSLGTLKNTGRPSCLTPEGLLKRILVTKSDFFFDISTARPTQADVQEAIQAGDAFMFAVVDEVEDKSSERQEYEASSGNSYTTRDAISGMRPVFTLSAYEFVNYLSFDNKQVRIFEFDHKEFLKGCKLDGSSDKFAGFATQRFDVENRTRPTDSSSVVQTPISIKYANPNEYRENIMIMDDMSFLENVNSLLDVAIIATDEAVSGVTIQALVDATGSPVIGLVLADFQILDDTGTEVTPDGVTDNADGTYAVLAELTAGTYTVGLQKPSDMTTEGYEELAKAEITIT